MCYRISVINLYTGIEMNEIKKYNVELIKVIFPVKVILKYFHELFLSGENFLCKQLCYGHRLYKYIHIMYLN